MKLNKRIRVNGEERKLAKEQVILELSAGGRATFVIEGNVSKHSLITFDIGYQSDYKVYFDGFVTRAQPAQNGYTKVIARERSGLLAARYPVSIQHPTASEVLEQLSFDTGLNFVFPDSAEYMTTRIANFTSQGSGYQLLNNLGRAFNINDFCWYQQTDGSIFVGSYADSRWATRAVDLPDNLTVGHMGGQSMTVSVLPSVRPGVIINGNRITEVHFENTDSTLYWKGETNAEKRKMQFLFPELAAGHHLPRLARVEAVTDLSLAGHEHNPFRPRYAVDVQLLDENGQADSEVPLYKAVSLPTVIGGGEQGQFALPIEGTIVEIAFAYGRSDRPFIRTILGDGWSLPTFEPGEQLTQQRHEVFVRTDAAGNHTQATDQVRKVEAYQELHQVEKYLAEFGTHELNTTQHSIEKIGAQKRIEALGNIELLSGDSITLGALENMHLSSGGEWVQIIGKLRDVVIGLDDKLKVLGNKVTTVEKDIEATAKNMRYTADTISMNGGSGDKKVLRACDFCLITGTPHNQGSPTVFAGD